MKLLGLLLLSVLCCANAFNITKILDGYPDYSMFNDDLTRTKLADEINSRATITVLVVNNAAMASLSGMDLASIKRALSLHVVLDFYDPEKLHQVTNGTTLSTTLYQTTGAAAGNGGFINITDLKGGKVGFGLAGHGAKLDSTYVKSVKQEGYNLSVVEVSQPITTSVAEAPTPSPSNMNITAVLIKGGCKIFADLISTTGVLKSYEDSIQGGLTVFAPRDTAFTGVANKMLTKLSSADKVAVLEFHALTIYSPLGTLKTSNGPIATMASTGAGKYVLTVTSSGDTVMLNTGINKATITSSLLDDQPLALFSVDKVLKPKELFVAAPAPTPTPEAEAPAPTATAKAKHGKSPAASEASKSTSTSFAPATAKVCSGLLAFLVGCSVGVFML